MQKIAIIEDDQTIAAMYRMKFESEGFEVEVAENGKLGVELCEQMLPDLILMDLQMPEMNGDEALKEIRKKDWGKDIPVIILTNTGEEEAPNDLKDLGVRHYIVKADLTPSQVLTQTKEVLGQE
jgi:DNA-binding response OmpR family regulator